MKNRILILIFSILSILSVDGQAWRTELDKHIKKPINEINEEMEKFFIKIGKTKENKYHKYQRWYDYSLNHQNEEGLLFDHSVKNKDLLKRMNSQIKKNSINNDSQSRHFHGEWTSINPNIFIVEGYKTPVNGRINCLAKPSPTSTIIYAGTATGGVWKSYNDGASWIPLWDGMVQTGVSSIVIDYNNPNHILALTGDADSKFIPTQGVFQSYNGGDTWTSVPYQPSTDELDFGYKLIQSKSNQYEYFIAKNGWDSIIKFNIQTNSFTTQNSGGTTFDIEYQTNENDILWAASVSGIYKQEGSNIWSEINHTNLPQMTMTRSAIAMAPSNPNVIYYAVAKLTNNSNFYGIYKSSDKGENWDIMYDTTKTDIMTYQCNYNFTLDVDPNNANKIFFGAGNLYESSMVDGEMTFTQIEDYLHADIHNSYHIGSNHYVCTDGGISVKKFGSSAYFGINNGLICTQFYDLSVHSTKIVGGTQDNGTMLWDLGDNTGYRKLGSDGFDCSIDPTNPNIMFASTQDSKVRSTDGMQSYTHIFNSDWHDPITYSVDDPDKIIIHANDELKVSTNNGVTFNTSYNVFSNSVNSISQCESDPNVIYLSKGDSLAWSNNFNANPTNVSWTKRKTFDIGVGKSVLVHPDSCNVVFLTSSGYYQNQIHKSIDGGNTFSSYSQGISELPVYCIYYDHVNGNGYYIGTELGIYYRNSSMDEWIPFSTYLPRVPVYDLQVNNNYIYAATYGRGIWRSPKFKACVSELSLTQANDPTAGNNSGHQIHKASNTIVSDRIIRGEDGTDVLYQAGNYIDLIEGFHAKNNNLFIAKAAGCSD